MILYCLVVVIGLRTHNNALEGKFAELLCFVFLQAHLHYATMNLFCIIYPDTMNLFLCELSFFFYFPTVSHVFDNRKGRSQQQLRS